MFLLWSFYSVVLCCATLCSVVTACFEDMTPVTHLHPERVTDCVPVSRLFAPSLSPCLDCSRLEITLSLPHSAITSHSALFPVGASRSYPSSPWYQLPTTNRPTPCLSPTFHIWPFDNWKTILVFYCSLVHVLCSRVGWSGLVWSGRSASSSSARAVVTALLAAAAGSIVALESSQSHLRRRRYSKILREFRHTQM